MGGKNSLEALNAGSEDECATIISEDSEAEKERTGYSSQIEDKKIEKDITCLIENKGKRGRSHPSFEGDYNDFDDGSELSSVGSKDDDLDSDSEYKEEEEDDDLARAGPSRTAQPKRRGRPAKKQQLSKDSDDDEEYKSIGYAVSRKNSVVSKTVGKPRGRKPGKPGRPAAQKGKPDIDENDVYARDRAGQTNLHRACQEGNLERVMDLIKRGSDINAQDHAGWTSLHEAALAGYLEIVQFLLEQGAEVNAASFEDGDTPLHDASAKGHAEVVWALMQYGADPEKTNVKEEMPEDHAMDDRVIDYLRTSVEIVRTPVNQTNKQGQLQDKKSKDEDNSRIGDSILPRNQRKRPHFMRNFQPSKEQETKKQSSGGKRGRPRIRRDDNSSDNLRSNIYPTGNRRRSFRDGRKLNGETHNNGARAFTSANDVLRMDLRFKDPSTGRTNLHLNAKRGNSEMVANMIEAGALINAKDHNGRTALHEAAYEGHTTTVEILIALGADVNIKDHKQHTPLHDASHKGHGDVVNILLANNAKPDDKNIDGKTPLDMARRRKDIVELLCDSLELDPDEYSGTQTDNTPSQVRIESDDDDRMLSGEESFEESSIPNTKKIKVNHTVNTEVEPMELVNVQENTNSILKISNSDVGPFYTVQLVTDRPGFPIAATAEPSSSPLFVVDFQVELFLQYPLSTLLEKHPNLVQREVTSIEKERLWPCLRSIVWVPPKCKRPSELGALEAVQRERFLIHKMHFVKFDQIIEVANLPQEVIPPTIPLDISDYTNNEMEDSDDLNCEDDDKNDCNVMEVDFASKLPLTPTSPTTPQSQWVVPMTETNPIQQKIKNSQLKTSSGIIKRSYFNPSLKLELKVGSIENLNK
ncbi:17490_t:CDS:2 [Funneliformis geosporum]|uniref:19172_t:CDS:1 n=1 Tax=Funneliformis geosporum TaxID=1117311 RepID=A0A9W4WLK2_9GLOM|nr:17490_t:CDS:2 [Funneliformis geosporum]CAI2162967.1 19172_t:CDS:2 [Funneliformis geosporum]